MHLLCPETSAHCSLLMPMIVFKIGRVPLLFLLFNCPCQSRVFESPSKDHRPCFLKLGVCLNLYWGTIKLILLGFVWDQPTTEEVRHWPSFYLICQKKWWHLNSVWTSKLKHVLFLLHLHFSLMLLFLVHLHFSLVLHLFT